MLSVSSRRAVTVAFAGVLILGASFAQAREPSAVPLDLSRPLATNARDLLEVGDAKALANVRKAAVIGFNVEFVTAGSAYAESREIGRTGTTGLSVHYRLTGLSPADLQAITDQLYDEFVRDLNAAGIEVVAPAAWQGAAAWRKIAAAGVASPMNREAQKTVSTVVAARGLPIWGFAAAPSTGGGVFGALGAFSAVGTAMTASFDTAELLTELGHPVLSVNMRVDFAELQSSSSSFLGRISGTAEVKANMGLALRSASLLVQQAQTGTQIALARPLTLQGEAITGVKDVSSVAGNVGLAVLSMAIGNGGMQQVREKEAQVDAARYREVVGTNLGAVKSMMVARLRAGGS